MPPETESARDVTVEKYGQILILPIILKDHSLYPHIEQYVTLFKEHGWMEVSLLSPPVPEGKPYPPRDDVHFPSYEEIVYFHPFVRDLLYGDGSGQPGGRSIRRLRPQPGEEVCRAKIELDGAVIDLVVERTELYLCKPHVAILVVEVVSEKAMSLWAAMALQKALRQAYPRYFNGEAAPGGFPRKVTWYRDPEGLKNPEEHEVPADYRGVAARALYAGTEPPVVCWWQRFLNPLLPYAGPDPEDRTCPISSRRPRESLLPRYQQVHNDSMPGMTYLAVDKPRAVAEGDYDRLVLCDSPGEEPLPYAPRFLTPLRTGYRYDRYWSRSGTRDTQDMTFDTRYLCSGYQFVAVGRAASAFFQKDGLGAFRTLYFRLALVAHYQRAALLKLADDASEALKLLKGVPHEQELSHAGFRERISYLQMTFLKFRNRAWFSEVSNQVQGQELYALWRRNLALDELCRHVDEGTQRLYAALAEYETRLLSRTAFRGLALTIGLSGVGIALASFADMKYTTVGIGFAVFLVAAALAGVELFLTGHGERSLLSPDRRGR